MYLHMAAHICICLYLSYAHVTFLKQDETFSKQPVRLRVS